MIEIHVILGGKKFSPSPISEKKMPNTICKKCGIEIWESYNYCSEHMPEFLDCFYKELQTQKIFK